MTGGRDQRIVDGSDGQCADRESLALEEIHLRDLFLERAAGERHTEHRLAEACRRRLLLQALRARILALLVAPDAVVRLPEAARLIREIPGLRDRLTSRFQGGLIADIQLPDVESKVAILHKKAAASGTHLTEDVAWFISSRVKSNIRELEGCLNRMIAMHSITGRPINIQLAKDVLKPLINTEDRIVTPQMIMETVALYYQLKAEELKSKNNAKAIVQPRQIAMYLAKELTQKSLPEIGELFGGRDHTTVLHAVRKIGGERGKDTELNQQLHVLEQTLKG